MDSLKTDSFTSQSSNTPYTSDATNRMDPRVQSFINRVSIARTSIFLDDKGLLYSQANPMSMINFVGFSKIPFHVIGNSERESWFSTFQANASSISANFYSFGIDGCNAPEGFTLTPHGDRVSLSQSYESFLAMAGQDSLSMANLQTIKDDLDPLVTDDLLVVFTVGEQTYRLLFYLTVVNGEFYVIGMYDVKCDSAPTE